MVNDKIGIKKSTNKNVFVILYHAAINGVTKNTMLLTNFLIKRDILFVLPFRMGK